MLIDTDVLIFAFRGNRNAIDILDNLPEKYISVITYMEILQGVFNKAEINKFVKYLKKYQFTILPLNEKIGELASDLVFKYTLSHNMQMPDALIASTAIVYDKELLSANYKHFQFISPLLLKKFIV